MWAPSDVKKELTIRELRSTGKETENYHLNLARSAPWLVLICVVSIEWWRQETRWE
jgi:hypothetical protein